MGSEQETFAYDIVEVDKKDPLNIVKVLSETYFEKEFPHLTLIDIVVTEERGNNYSIFNITYTVKDHKDVYRSLSLSQPCIFSGEKQQFLLDPHHCSKRKK